VEHQRVERDSGDAQPHPIQDGDGTHHLAPDARLLQDLLDHHLGGRIAHVGPTGRVEPDAGVGPLHHQELAGVVAHDRPDGHLRRHVAGHPTPHRTQPVPEQGVHVEGPAGEGVGPDPDLRRHLEDLLVALPLVERLREAEAGPGRAGEGLGPAQEVQLGGRAHAVV